MAIWAKGSGFFATAFLQISYLQYQTIPSPPQLTYIQINGLKCLYMSPHKTHSHFSFETTLIFSNLALPK